MIGVAAAAISCFFWLVAAGVRFRPITLFRLRGPESLPEALQRQSLLNAVAAFCAAIAAACQGAAFLMDS
jgi:hypothetical protein